jgi:hypothetical protein
VIPKLTAEDVPAEARELKDELAGMLPFAPIASLLDQRTRSLDCFVYAGGRKQGSGEDSRSRWEPAMILVGSAVVPGAGVTTVTPTPLSCSAQSAQRLGCC